MDAKRIPLLILVMLMPFSTAIGQDKVAESARKEALTLKAQMVELESWKADSKEQGEKDRSANSRGGEAR
jgi:hypothetical protein